MQDENPVLPAPKHTAWNKGKLIGAKSPLLENANSRTLSTNVHALRKQRKPINAKCETVSKLPTFCDTALHRPIRWVL